MKRTVAVVVSIIATVSALSAASTLDIYFIDVEGGQATLIVTPAGQSLLVDAGYGGFENRDTERIMAAARDARIARLDYLVITHMHGDHIGGAPEIARRLPIATFVDYGDPLQSEASVVVPYVAYAAIRKNGVHVKPAPGDRISLTGVGVEVVSSGGAVLSKPVDGAGQPNPACTTFAPRPIDPTENPRSTGFRLTFGRFTFLDLGDLSWNKLAELVCPVNLLGHAEVYLVPHHANNDSNVPAVLAAVTPRVAIANNGPWKGGSRAALATLQSLEGLEDLWQLHRQLSEGVRNAGDDFVANLEEEDKDTGAWIKLSASEDGSFTVTNGRTGFTKKYSPK